MAENKADACALFTAVEGQCRTGSSSALVEPRATTDIDLLMLIEQPTREGIQSLLASQFDSTVVHPAPMVFRGISIWRCVGIRGGQDVVVDLLLADSEYLKTALSRRRMIVFGELNVPILAIEDLSFPRNFVFHG